MAAVTRNGGARGLSWMPEEIKEVLNLWGKERVQEVLRNHHRNIATFESIAHGMVERDTTAQHRRVG